MKFSYKACDPSGSPRQGTVDGDDMGHAMDSLRRQGLYVTQIDPFKGSSDTPHQPVRGGRRRMSKGRLLKNLAVFSRQLYLLTSSGTPLTEGLHSLQKQSKDTAWRNVLTQLCKTVEQGESL